VAIRKAVKAIKLVEGWQFSWALQGRLKRTDDPVQLRVESPAEKKRVSCKSAAVKRRLYMCCSYSESLIITMLKSVARIRPVKTEKT
jgi:hypothetical protein